MKYTKEFLKGIYENLLYTRMIEQKMVDIYAKGRVPGHVHSGVGEEAAYVGVLSTRKEGDYFKLGHRPIALPYMLGTSLDVFFGELLAKTTGNSGGLGGSLHIGELSTGYLGMSGTLGSDTGVAVGAAMSIDMRGTDNVSYMFFGDGTTSRGPVYEAMNLAAAWKLPVLFVCLNNQFAISTHTSKMIPLKNVLADRAPAFGMEAKVVDGSNLIEVYEAAKALTDNIRSGNGPAILECKNYRWRGHFEGDSTPYRDSKITEEYIENKDCLKNYENYLFEKNIISKEEADNLKAAFDQLLDETIAKAEAEPIMPKEDIEKYLFA